MKDKAGLMKPSRQLKKGFTLIELLTVIAIIAVLAAIIFPVFGRVRAQVRETNCLSNMHELYIAAKLYREDNGKFPAALLGFVQSDIIGIDGKPIFHTELGAGHPISLDLITYRPLTTSQKYIKEFGVFNCPDALNNATYKDAGRAWYPAGVPLAGPVLFQSLVKENCCSTTDIPIGNRAYYYKFDSYDTGLILDANGKPTSKVDFDGVPVTQEIHYSLDWTGGSGPNDPSNQLKYPDPPQDKTVITWCNHHVGYAGSNKYMVLLLNGKASAVPASHWTSPLNP